MKTIRFPMAAAMAAACVALAACDDALLAPEPESAALLGPAVAEEAVAVVPELSNVRALNPSDARVAVEDVMNRLLPALEPGGLTTAIGAGLLQALAAVDLNDVPAARRAVRAAEQALDQYERRADVTRAPDIDAVRLTIEALSAR